MALITGSQKVAQRASAEVMWQHKPRMPTLFNWQLKVERVNHVHATPAQLMDAYDVQPKSESYSEKRCNKHEAIAFRSSCHMKSLIVECV